MYKNKGIKPFNAKALSIKDIVGTYALYRDVTLKGLSGLFGRYYFYIPLSPVERSAYLGAMNYLTRYHVLEAVVNSWLEKN